MPITLDPVTALVIIDLQLGIAGMPCAHPVPPIIENAATLARAFRAKNLPVVLVNVAGLAPGRTETKRNWNPPPNWTELCPELERAPSDILVTKYNVGAFYGTGLEMQLRRRSVTQIVLCGIATGSGVESTARAAYDHGFNVAFVTDAMTDRVAEVHTHCIERTFPRLGELGSTADVLALLG